MNLEDESYLSATLDQELDLSDQERVEWAIEADPELHERFLALSQTHELLASLPRPAIPVDLAPSIVAQLHQRQRKLRARTIYRVALWTATAASVLAAVLFSQSPNILRSNPAGPRQIEPVIAANQPALNSVVESMPNPSALISSHSSASSTSSLLTTGTASAHTVVEKQTDAITNESPSKLLALLDQPEVRRVIIPLDRLGGDPVGTVDQIVRESSRKDPDYARFTLTPGLIIDPSHPQGAEVFVVLVDENERRHLLAELGTHFPSIGEETLALSEIPALLAEVGKVSILPGKSAAGLIDPPPPFEAVATKFHSDPSRQPERRLMSRPLVDAGPQHPAPPTGFRFDSLIKESPRPTDRGRSPDGRVTLIVWVPRADRAD